MANLDITRHLLQRNKHYAGARMQQGRSLLDSDWNEDAMLVAEDLRETLIELVGIQGSANNGFAVTGVEIADTYDFELMPGSFFLGGHRLQLEEPEALSMQADWLRWDVEAGPPSRPSVLDLLPLAEAQLVDLTPADVAKLPPARRHDLVLLESWEQPVTAVEDAELRERALGGPDSSARVRRMRRVHVVSDIGTDNPADALIVYASELANKGFITLEDGSTELLSTARLTVTPVSELGDGLCGPQPASGYVGHEDQAIRVEMRGDTSITWGFNDAAPLYRVKVGVDLRHITFLNQPRDVKLQPRAGQIVELVPWSAKLPNGEMVAELTGQLFRVATGYNPASRELELETDAPQEWIDWFNQHLEHWDVDDELSRYFYLRVWDRGSDTSSDPTIDLADAPVELGHTGLQVRLSGKGRPGDYWVLAARRGAPDTVVPWRLLDNDAPLGPRRFVSPLAVIQWEARLELLGYQDALAAHNGDTGYAILSGADLAFGQSLHAVWRHPTASVIDGRCKLQRLCVRGCCTITVGDGNQSNGMVNDLQEALDMLPNSGGRICLLPGVHAGEVELVGVTGVTISGCGRQSVLQNVNLVTPADDLTTKGASVIKLQDCQDITLENFAVFADRAIGVEIRGLDDECKRIRIEGVEFTQDGTYMVAADPTPDALALPQPAVLALGGEDLTVKSCRVLIADKLSYAGALVLGGTRVRIHENWVQVGEFQATGVAEAMGGIHVLSQSVDVEVIGNRIHGGWGYGVALGHALSWDPAPVAAQTITMSEIWAAAERGVGEAVSSMFEYEPIVDAPRGAPEPAEEFAPAGHLVDVRIGRNHISKMGLSGISTGVMRFSHVTLAGGEYAAFIVVVRLLITSNHIQENLQITTLDTKLFAPRDDGCCDLDVGGITVCAAIDCTVAENRVVNNGADSDTPSCGLGFIAMQNLVVSDNYVVDNGLEGVSPVPEGLRGGIAIQEVTALRGDTYLDTLHFNILIPQPSFTVGKSTLALKVHKNEVAHRNGKALWVRGAFNDVQVTENSFTSKGDPASNATIEDSELHFSKALGGTIKLGMGGACVEILGMSLASEVDWSMITELPGIRMVDPEAGEVIGGAVKFCDNRGLLDWAISGGHAAAYLISSLDTVLVSNNQLEVDTHEPNDVFDDGYIADVTATPGLYKFVITNCYAGAAGAVQVRGNRFREGVRDALLSVIAGPAVVSPDTALTELREASLTTSCVGDHCGTSATPSNSAEIVAHNVFINVSPGSGCSYTHAHEQLASLHVVRVSL